jgi:hypothetical protein
MCSRQERARAESPVVSAGLPCCFRRGHSPWCSRSFQQEAHAVLQIGRVVSEDTGFCVATAVCLAAEAVQRAALALERVHHVWQ